MKKSNITGWKDVFSFTLVQTLKSKAYIISFVLFMVLSLVTIPAITLITSNDSIEESENPITKVYVFNNTALPLEEFPLEQVDESLGHITFIMSDKAYDDVLNQIEENENTAIALNIKEEQGTYSLNFVRASNGAVKDSNISIVANAVQRLFEEKKIEYLGISNEQLTVINSIVETKVSNVDTAGTEIIEEDTSIAEGEYGFIYGLLFVIMMINTMAGSQIATSIVSDKSSKVIEYLLTSVKPLAVMVGKVLAMLSAVLIQVVSTIVLFYVSNKIAVNLLHGDNLLEQFVSGNILSHINVINIIFCIILFTLGMIFYATLAGLAGATVSRIEEASESLTVFMISNLVGVYIGFGAASVLLHSGMNTFVYFALLFPLSSPFLLPGAILVGKANILIIAVAIVLQLIVITLLFRFVARVYETLILHNGNKIGMKELFKISKTA